MRFKPKLNRQEKLLFIVPLLALAWPLLSVVKNVIIRDSLDKGLHRLAGRGAIDCGLTPTTRLSQDSCAIAAFQARKPFFVRQNIAPARGSAAVGMALSPQGQLYLVFYSRPAWDSKVELSKVLCLKPMVFQYPRGGREIIYDYKGSPKVSTTFVWR